jgi:hypothetical protein
MKATITPPIKRTITIEMTENEAAILMSAIGSIGGAGAFRESIASLYRALDDLNIRNGHFGRPKWKVEGDTGTAAFIYGGVAPKGGEVA